MTCEEKLLRCSHCGTLILSFDATRMHWFNIKSVSDDDDVWLCASCMFFFAKDGFNNMDDINW